MICMPDNDLYARHWYIQNNTNAAEKESNEQAKNNNNNEAAAEESNEKAKNNTNNKKELIGVNNQATATAAVAAARDVTNDMHIDAGDAEALCRQLSDQAIMTVVDDATRAQA